MRTSLSLNDSSSNSLLTRIFNSFVIHFLSVAIASTLVACGSGAGGSSTPSAAQDSCTASAGSTCIGAAGGIVIGAGGASLQIPAGALKTNQAFQLIETSEGSPAQPIGTSAAGAVWQVLPHGVNFDLTATLTLPYDATAMSAAGHTGELPWLYKAQPGGVYALQAAVSPAGSGLLKIGISSLSYFSLRTNKAPVALLSLPSGTAVQGQTLTFSAAASSDAEGRISSYEWSFGDEAAGASPLVTTSESASHSYRQAGLYTISLTVTDEAGSRHSAAASIQIIAPNIPPVAQISAISSAQTGQSVNFSGAQSSDLDGRIVSYAWNFGDGASAIGVNAAHTYANPGNYIVTLSVTDDRNASAATSYSVIVNPNLGSTSSNQAPTARISVPASLQAGQSLTFSAASSSDPDGSISGYAWSVQSQASPSFTVSASGVASSTLVTNFPSPGNYVIGLTVTDNRGATHSIASIVQVGAANLPPTARLTVGSSAVVGEMIGYSGATSSDPDGRIVNYAFSFSDEQAAQSGSATSGQRSFSAAGVYILTLTVTDDAGASHSTSRSIFVNPVPAPNSAPTARITVPGTVVIAGQTASFSGITSSDPDGSIVSFVWNFSDPASGSANSARGVTVSHSFNAPGTYPVALSVADDQGAVNIVVINITVIAVNQAPVAQIASNILTASIVTGQEIVLSPAASSDSDGTITSYRWSLADGTSTTIITNASATQSIYSFTTPGLRTATLIVTDNQGATNSYALSISVQSYSATGALNDTGQDWCSENITTPSTWVNNVVCSTFNWVGNLWGTMQDAYFGRDAQANAGTLTKIGTGMAGFDFTRIGASGQPLAIQTATYSATGNETAGTRWDCIRDNVTGMYWEIKRKNDPTHLRHYTATFTWYSTDFTNNGGNAGTEIGGVCNGVADTTKCNTQAYVTAINSLPAGQALCGFRDWRMAVRDELSGISHLGRFSQAIDSNQFPETTTTGFWTANTDSGTPGQAWTLVPIYGNDSNSLKSGRFNVRLMRSGQ